MSAATPWEVIYPIHLKLTRDDMGLPLPLAEDAAALSTVAHLASKGISLDVAGIPERLASLTAADAQDLQTRVHAFLEARTAQQRAASSEAQRLAAEMRASGAETLGEHVEKVRREGGDEAAAEVVARAYRAISGISGEVDYE